MKRDATVKELLDALPVLFKTKAELYVQQLKIESKQDKNLTQIRVVHKRVLKAFKTAFEELLGQPIKHVYFASKDLKYFAVYIKGRKRHNNRVRVSLVDCDISDVYDKRVVLVYSDKIDDTDVYQIRLKTIGEEVLKEI